MTRSILSDAFDHHVWATLRILDALAGLSDEQLATTVPGTYGSILETARHLVGADRWYLFTLSNGAVGGIAEESMSIADLRDAMAPTAASWRALLETNPDPDEDFVLTRDDGSESHATWGVRLAQAVHHGTDHRSQLATALTTLGITPPDMDVWDWAITVGKHHVTEVESVEPVEPVA
jgi:uncharacterized damage-inducible protein DinB